MAGAVAELPEDLSLKSFDQEVVLAELAGSSLVTRFLKDSRDLEAPGRDRVAIHESLCVVADGRWEYPGIYVLVLSNALDGRARPLRDAARIQAAASYLPAGTNVLTVAATMLEVGDQLPFAPAMHNAGDLLLLTGSAEQASFWLTQAAEVYAARIENDRDAGMRMVEYFFASAGRLTTALARTPHTDRIDRVVEFALGVANAHPDAVSMPMVQAALDMMAGTVQVLGSPETELLAEVRKLRVLAARSEYSPQNMRGQVFVWVGALKITAGSVGTAAAGTLVASNVLLPVAIAAVLAVVIAVVSTVDRAVSRRSEGRT
ncbi:hypothetical protein [Microbacterium sp. NPDC089696]|uniref:hypothetical protein n=1 Tax=Microbacterium sp. NPDC089696 TaxID=3364199 RepID=UPI0038194F71